jgi:ParB family chromosome partitioning protein
MSTTSVPATPVSPFQSLPIDQLHPNPWNRTVFDSEAMKDLVASIKAVGIKEPLIVRLLPEGDYQIASGHRRWLAAKDAGLTEVPCWVQTLNDEQVAEDNITINIQREDLPPLELARMLSEFMDHYHKSQRDTAALFGKTEGWVSQYVGYLTLHPDLKNFTAVKFLTGDLRALKQLTPDLQQQIAKELNEGSLKLEHLQKRCHQLKAGGKSPFQKPKLDGNDPMAGIWAKIKGVPMNNAKWEVAYPKDELWSFTIHPNGGDYAGFLAEWFDNMAQAIKTHDPLLASANTPEPEADGMDQEVQKILAAGRIL